MFMMMMSWQYEKWYFQKHFSRHVPINFKYSLALLRYWQFPNNFSLWQKYFNFNFSVAFNNWQTMECYLNRWQKIRIYHQQQQQIIQNIQFTVSLSLEEDDAMWKICQIFLFLELLTLSPQSRTNFILFYFANNSSSKLFCSCIDTISHHHRRRLLKVCN